MFSGLVQWFVELWNYIWAAMQSALTALYHKLVDVLFSLIPDGVTTFLHNVDLSIYTDMMQIVSHIMPLQIIFYIMSTAFGLVALIRFIRWVAGVQIFGSTLGS